MTTPLIMLAILALPLLFAVLLRAAGGPALDTRNMGAVGLAIVFVFTAIGHFTQTETMAQMLPAWVPGRILLVHATGVLEFAIAAGLLFPACRKLAGYAAAAVLVLFFPANVYAAIHHVPMGGHAWGPAYLLVRAPLQGILLFWAYWFVIRVPGRVRAVAHSY